MNTNTIPKKPTFDDNHRHAACLRGAAERVKGRLQTALKLLAELEHRPMPSKISGQLTKIDEILLGGRRAISGAKQQVSADRKRIRAEAHDQAKEGGAK